MPNILDTAVQGLLESLVCGPRQGVAWAIGMKKGLDGKDQDIRGLQQQLDAANRRISELEERGGCEKAASVMAMLEGEGVLLAEDLKATLCLQSVASSTSPSSSDDVSSMHEGEVLSASPLARLPNEILHHILRCILLKDVLPVLPSELAMQSAVPNYQLSKATGANPFVLERVCHTWRSLMRHQLDWKELCAARFHADRNFSLYNLSKVQCSDYRALYRRVALPFVTSGGATPQSFRDVVLILEHGIGDVFGSDRAEVVVTFDRQMHLLGGGQLQGSGPIEFIVDGLHDFVDALTETLMAQGHPSRPNSPSIPRGQHLDHLTGATVAAKLVSRLDGRVVDIYTREDNPLAVAADAQLAADGRDVSLNTMTRRHQWYSHMCASGEGNVHTLTQVFPSRRHVYDEARSRFRTIESLGIKLRMLPGRTNLVQMELSPNVLESPINSEPVELAVQEALLSELPWSW